MERPPGEEQQSEQGKVLHFPRPWVPPDGIEPLVESDPEPEPAGGADGKTRELDNEGSPSERPAFEAGGFWERGLRGHAAMDQALSELAEVWDSELEPAYILDLGDRVLLLGFNHMRARTSELQLEQEYAQLLTVRDGLIGRDESWSRWEEGLRAAGLEPDAIALPKRRRAGEVASTRSP